MVIVNDIKNLIGITFSRYGEYIPEKTTGYPDYKLINESYYLNHPGDNGTIREFSYGCLSHGIDKGSDIPFEDLLITSDYMTGSDYSGSTVELSNYEVFKELFGDLPGVYRVYGGYGTFSMAISVKWLLNPDNEEKANEIIDTLKALSDYPLIDDEHLSNMESEKEYEYITTDWARYELPREFRKQHHIELLDLTDQQVWSLYRDLSDRANQYPLFETNGWPYIYTEEIVKVYKVGDLARYDIPHELTED